ncbi:hypothetical protein ILUMI_18234, partial [Ignelater luminosus]
MYVVQVVTTSRIMFSLYLYPYTGNLQKENKANLQELIHVQPNITAISTKLFPEGDDLFNLECTNKNDTEYKALNEPFPKSKELSIVLASADEDVRSGSFSAWKVSGLVRNDEYSNSDDIQHNNSSGDEYVPSDNSSSSSDPESSSGQRTDTDLKKRRTFTSQTFTASMLSKHHEYLGTSRIKKEIFDIMRADDASAVAKSDSLICLYSETLLAKHKRQQIATVGSSRIREMARMLMTIKSMDSDVCGMFDALRPDMFKILILAAKIVSGYDEDKKVSELLHWLCSMGTNLNILCNVAFKLVMEKRKLLNICWNDRNEKKNEIKDLRKLIEAHWCNEISSLAIKTLKERQWEKPVQLPLSFLHFKHISYLKMETYNKENRSINQEAFTKSLTAVEKIISKQLKRAVTGGKGSKPVPILFTKRTQKYLTCILKIRETTNTVPKSNPYMLANPGSENRWMAGTNGKELHGKNLNDIELDQDIYYNSESSEDKSEDNIESLLERVLRKRAKTDSEMKMKLNYPRRRKNLNKEHTTDEVTDRLEEEFEGAALTTEKNIQPDSEIELSRMKEKNYKEHTAKEVTDSSEEFEEILYKDNEIESPKKKEEVLSKETTTDEDKEFRLLKKQPNNKKVTGRIRWIDQETKFVLNYFRHHLKSKITPKEHECDQFLAKYGERLVNKDW